MCFAYTVNPVLCNYSKIDKTKVLKIYGSLVQVESIAECSRALEHSAILLTSLLKTKFWSFLSGCLRQVIMYDFYFGERTFV